MAKLTENLHRPPATELNKLESNTFFFFLFRLFQEMAININKEKSLNRRLDDDVVSAENHLRDLN